MHVLRRANETHRDGGDAPNEAQVLEKVGEEGGRRKRAWRKGGSEGIHNFLETYDGKEAEMETRATAKHGRT